MGGVGVIRGISRLACGLDCRPALSVVLCQTVCGTFRRCRFQIIKVAVLLLIIGQTVSHMIQHFLGKFLGPLVGHVRTEPVGIQSHFVHTDQTDGGEMVVKGA